MRKIRNFLATALAVVMAISVSVPAFAAEAVPGDENIPTATEASLPSNGDGGVAMPMTSGNKICHGVGSG